MIYKGLIFYSSYIFDETSLSFGKDFLNVCKEKFKDYAIFIGIQKGSSNEWISILDEEKLNLNIFYELCDDRFYVDSDVSGYQVSLNIFYKLKNEIKIHKNSFVWFGHSKGVTTKNHMFHSWNILNFWSKKEYIESRLNDKNEYGCYGIHLSYIPNYEKTNISDLWKEYCDFPFIKPVLNYMFVNTFFVIKSNCFIDMINHINNCFFDKKIKGINGEGDRYFFERDFIHFVEMMGYEPIYSELSPNISWMSVIVGEFEKKLELWKKI